MGEIILSSEVITTKNVDINMLSPMMKEIYDYMQQYPDDIVLTRVGDISLVQTKNYR